MIITENAISEPGNFMCVWDIVQTVDFDPEENHLLVWTRDELPNYCVDSDIREYKEARDTHLSFLSNKFESNGNLDERETFTLIDYAGELFYKIMSLEEDDG